jgi:signal transduction histidine kinase
MNEPRITISDVSDPPTLLLGSLLDGEIASAREQIRSAFTGGASHVDVYVDLLEPAMVELGRRWETQQVTVAQEHFVTAGVQQLMAELEPSAFAVPRRGRRVVAACVEGAMHTVGLRMICDVLELAGWDTWFLGADTPHADMLAEVARRGAEVLAVSASLPEQVETVRRLVADVRSSPELRGVRVLVGGRPFAGDPALWRAVGADGWARDVREAAAVAERLLEDPGAAAAPQQPDRRVAPVRHVTARENDEHALWLQLTRMNSKQLDTQRALGKSNAELQARNAELNQILGMAAHDLRNPLAVIVTNIDLLAGDVSDAIGPEQAEMLDDVRASAAFMKSLLDDLLEGARFRAGALRVARAAVDVAALAREVVRTGHTAAGRKGIALVAEGPHSLVAAVDASRIRQVLHNLVSNAISHSAAGGAVRVGVDAQDGVLRLTVADQGRGMSAEQLGRLFKPFAAGKAGTAGERSTGLGLAIVDKIVSAHGGRVSVESEVGRGSTFTVAIPLVAA